MTSAEPIPSKLSLLCLPDEALIIIFNYLQAFNTSGSFQTPRSAFSLALTNSRLLRIFSNGFTHITPDISNDTSATLSHGHMQSVIKLAGHSLLELHLPMSSRSLLPQIPKLCPSLESLSFVDRPEEKSLEGLADVLDIPIQSLSIHEPCRFALRMLITPPEELVLTKVSRTFIPHLTRILLNPPRIFSLSLDELAFESELSVLLESLHKAVPKIEDFTVKTCVQWPDESALFLEDALQILTAPRNNHRSKCRKMVLQGNVMSLVRHAHPEAFIQITRWGQTFVSNGEDLYVKAIPLLYDEYLEHDLSRLEQVSMEGFDLESPEWKEKLSSLSLSRAWVRQPARMAKSALTVDVVLVPLMNIFEADWKWLKNISEIRLLDFYYWVAEDEVVEFFNAITRLLDNFRGKAVFMDHTPEFNIERHLKAVRLALKNLERALEGFEASGGDAGTVRAMIKRTIMADYGAGEDTSLERGEGSLSEDDLRSMSEGAKGSASEGDEVIVSDCGEGSAYKRNDGSASNGNEGLPPEGDEGVSYEGDEYIWLGGSQGGRIIYLSPSTRPGT